MPLVSKTFDQLLDFTRTTSGTFVGSNGLIQNTAASRNLFPFTQEFNNAAWFRSNTTVTANTTVAPDGTSTADKLIETTSTTSHLVLRAFNATATPYTISFYAKAAERSWCYVCGNNESNLAYFDLANGVVGSTANITSASISAVGNGWYRCSIVRTLSAGENYPGIGIATADLGKNYTGDGTSGIFIWGAQMELGNTLTTYTRNNGGVYPPRFDYDPVTLAPKGILIEEQRTNLATYSEQFDNAAWIKIDTSVTTNATTAPDGTTTADLVIASTAASTAHIVFRNAVNTFALNAPATISFYAKAAGYNFAAASIFFNGNSSGAGVVFDLVNLTSTTISAAGDTTIVTRVVDAGNGWRRCVLTVTSPSSTLNSATISMSPTASPSANFGYRAPSFTGDGTSGIYVWGAQLEAGAFATSYIPTVASQVTRTADTTSIVAPNFAPFYNQSEGTFFAEFSGNGSYALAVNDGTSPNYSGIVYVNSTTTRGVTASGATYQFVQMAGGAAGTVNKTAYAYKLGDLAGSTNGGAVVTSTSTVIPTVIQMLIGTFGGFGQLNGHVRSIRYFPTRLSNAQLQALTA